MDDNKVKIITEDVVYKSIITVLGLAFIIIMSIALYQMVSFTLKFYISEIILFVISVNVFASFIGIFRDIKNRIKLKKNIEL